MTLTNAPLYRVHGLLGSPYSMKMLALMRYRRLPHVWIQLHEEQPGVFSQVKVPVVPIVEYADHSFHNDSTVVIDDLEQQHPGVRSVLPEDSGVAFLAYLLEDMADEWVTKIMFNYRWTAEDDQSQVSRFLAFDRLAGHGRTVIEEAADAFRARQVSRMDLVGCTSQNRPLIEQTFRTLLEHMEQLVLERPYLFGTRPSVADFGLYGQLSQLADDPTPAAIMRAQAPYTFRWVANIADASGVEGEWYPFDQALGEGIRKLLQLAGTVYLPMLAANDAALVSAEPSFHFQAQGHCYEQAPFKYQQRCLRALRSRFTALDHKARTRLEPILEETGCLQYLHD